MSKIKLVDMLEFADNLTSVNTRGYGEQCRQCLKPIEETRWVRKYYFRRGKVRMINAKDKPTTRYYHEECAKRLNMI